MMSLNGENRSLTAYYPAKKFPFVSVTGTRCDQMCEHCKAFHLRDMIPAESPDTFNELAQSLIRSGGKGLMISGGCDINGSVPLTRYARAISGVSEKLCINAQTGFVSKREAEELVRSGVSYFSVDIHQNEGEIRSILHLEHSAEDYARLLDDIQSAGGRIVPYITVGFGYDDLVRSGNLLVSKGITDVILQTMMPTPGTEVEESVLTADAIIDAVKLLSEMGLRITLGCMRDYSLSDLEIRCVEAGVEHIANPSAETMEWAKKEGYEITVRDVCCCIR